MADVTVKRYVPYGAARQAFAERGPEILCAGAAGTGKSLGLLWKVHAMALANPRMKALLIRKTQLSLSNTGLETFRRHVIPEALLTGVVSWYGGSTQEPAQYRYSNGSSVHLGGMDKPSKVMSSEYDVCYVQEATELTLNDWEALTTRLRNNVVSFQQMIADCNPDAPTHWLKQRCEDGKTLMLYSKHEDNPTLYDPVTGELTVNGAAYMSKLDALTGVRLQRLRYGRWVAAEGVIYEEWDPNVHLVDRASIPYEWTRIWSVDFGFTNPFVLQCWAIDPDGRAWLYREIYKTKTLVEDHARHILSLVTRKSDGAWKEPKPRLIVCDHDAEDRATLERHLGMGTTAAQKTVSDGIQAVAQRLRPAGDGKPRLFILRDALVERDQELADAGKPTCTKDEMPGYVWEPPKDGRAPKEEPHKEDDHGCLIAGTMILTDLGEVPIERIASGARVRTRQGWRVVLAAGMTQESAPVLRVELSNGSHVTGTGSHPLWVCGRGWVRLDALRYSDRLTSWLNQSDTTESFSVATPNRRITPTVSTTLQELRTDRTARVGSTRKYGRIRTARFLMSTTSIMSTLMHPTMISQTFNAYPSGNISRYILSSERSRAGTLRPKNLRTWNGLGHSLRSGTRQTRGVRGIARMGSSLGRGVALSRIRASTAVAITKRAARRGRSVSVPMLARLVGASIPASTTLTKRVHTVVKFIGRISTSRRNVAHVSVLSVNVLPMRVPVYNLTVEGAPEFYANGVLVHNCDSLRYMCAELDLAARPRVRTIG